MGTQRFISKCYDFPIMPFTFLALNRGLYSPMHKFFKRTEGIKETFNKSNSPYTYILEHLKVKNTTQIKTEEIIL